MTTAAAFDDAYPLSPMQQGMLYQTLASPGRGVYCIVVSYRLKGPLHAERFIEAWRRVVAHHAVLRTSFEWAEGGQARQIVNSRVAMAAHEEDWRQAGAAEQAERLARFLDAEHRREFDLAVAPLLRLSLLRCGDDVHEFVLTHHHILMDGSCKPLLFAQVFSAYEALMQGQPVVLAPSRPFRDFIAWLRAQPVDEAEAFWRQTLRGFAATSRLWDGAPAPASPARDYEERRVRLDTDVSEALRLVARRSRLTGYSIMSGVWALLLSRAGGSDDVVFGSTVNARPTDLDGADSMLGLFINTLPVRVRIDRTATTGAWLKALQASQAGIREYAATSLSSIIRWSGLPGGQPLFESVLVFENNAGYDGRVERYGDVEIVAVQPVIRNSLPLTLRCVPHDRFEFHLLYDTSRFAAATIAGIADDITGALRALPRLIDAPLSALLDELADLERGRVQQQAESFRQGRQDRLRAIRGQTRRTTGTTKGTPTP